MRPSNCGGIARRATSPARHWLQLRLTGRKSNRSAIGAEVRCRAGGRLQVRTVSGSVGYASTSDLTVHFGLGDATARVGRNSLAVGEDAGCGRGRGRSAS